MVRNQKKNVSSPSVSRDHSTPHNRNTAIILISLVVFMLALSFASVPIYRIFCQRTGYGGTIKIAQHASTHQLDRVINIRFNADVHRDLPWKFKPLQKEIQVYVGETGLAFYQVKNKTSTDIIGIATYNVTPDKAAQYFYKVHCFCFEEQIINAYETADMPVQFFIDPAIMEDADCNDITEITLSYTFFHAKDPNIPDFLGLPNAARHQIRQLNKG